MTLAQFVIDKCKDDPDFADEFATIWDENDDELWPLDFIEVDGEISLRKV